ncbi:ATP-binding protein [Nocardia sp. NPDC059177]|uniref:ATP-binding protein n=1 Tax=Nocardia sp. NPDC059177 TaxID=3346759 RepID=UPI003677301F
MFDRTREWEALTRFVTSGQPHATLGIVSGRRRQGKSFLLEALCEATGGFYFAADQATEAESLRYFSTTVADYSGSALPVSFDDWRQAMDGLLAVTAEREVPVVIDEFPYLAKASPALPSIVQAALAPRRAERMGSRGRLLLCGSALSFMGSLLSGDAPLRGRAGLELVVPTLDYRLAAEFWGIEDPRLAVLVHAIVGGTPAYRREFVEDDTPSGLDDFDDWVERTVLNPASPLFREARYLLSEEPGLRDPGLYHSVLSAVAHGNPTTGGISSYVGRKASDVAHPVAVLEDCGLLRREPDLFRGNRILYRINEPLVTFYQAILRPDWAQWERGRDTAQLWQRRRSRFDANVLGPHFEQICRDWVTNYAPPEILGGYPGTVGSGIVNDPANRTTHEVDVVVFGEGPDGTESLLSIGEVKWNDTMGMGHLDRLRRIRDLLSAKYDTSRTRLICYSAAGFMPGLANEAVQGADIVLIGLADLYR